MMTTNQILIQYFLSSNGCSCRKSMKRINIVLAMLLIGVIMSPANVWANRGREIMEKNDNLPKSNTAKSKAVLYIFKGGCQAAACAERKDFNLESIRLSKNITHSLLTFTSPTQLKFLTWSQAGSDSSQWIKPSRSGVRKIASGDKGNSFVNSHFYYEDMSDRNLNDYNYSYIGEGSVGSTPVFKVQAVKKGRSPVYSKMVVYLRQSDYVIVRIDLYEKGRHTKTVYNERIEQISGIYTPRKVVMQRTDGKGKSILYLQTTQYNQPVSRTKMKPTAL